MKKPQSDKQNTEVIANNELNERLNESDQQEEMGITHLGFSYFLDKKNENGVENDLKTHR